MPILDLKAALNSEVLIGCGQREFPWEASISGPESGKGDPIWVTESRRHPLMLLCHPFFSGHSPQATLLAVVTATQ